MKYLASTIILCALLVALSPSAYAQVRFSSQTLQGDLVVRDARTGLVWQGTPLASGTRSQAINYCDGLTYAGYDDWRVPTKKTLMSLVNYAIAQPASDFPGMPTEVFWSSSSHAPLAANAWRVDFGDGNVGLNRKNAVFLFVVCVEFSFRAFGFLAISSEAVLPVLNSVDCEPSSKLLWTGLKWEALVLIRQKPRPLGSFSRQRHARPTHGVPKNVS